MVVVVGAVNDSAIICSPLLGVRFSLHCLVFVIAGFKVIIYALIPVVTASGSVVTHTIMNFSLLICSFRSAFSCPLVMT